MYLLRVLLWIATILSAILGLTSFIANATAEMIAYQRKFWYSVPRWDFKIPSHLFQVA